MALYEVEAPDGELLKIEGPEGASEQEVISQAQKLYTPAQKDTGFTGAARSSYEKMKGEGALVLGKLGLMDTDEAEKYYNSKKKKADTIFQPTEKGWDEAPFEKFRELLGSSAPYMVAPLAAAGAVAAAPEALAGASIGAIGAPAIAGFAANVGQFTGTNLARQVDEGKSLNDASLATAAAAAVPQSILDIASDHMIPGVKNIFGKAGIKLADDEAAAIAKQQLTKSVPQGKIATALEYGGKAAQTAAIEGLNEAGQQVFERLQAGLDLTDPQARQEYFDNFIGGAVLGGAISVPGHYYDKNVEQPRQAKMLALQQQAEERKKQLEEQQRQQQELQQTYQNLNVPQTTNLLPAPEKAAPIPEKNMAPAIQQDMLSNYNGHFGQQAIDNIFGKGAFDQINDMREMDHGKPRLKEMSIEDLAHAGANPEDLSRLLTVHHDYTNVKEKNFAPAQVEKLAEKKGIETGTKGFNDFLMRTTGTDNLKDMTYAQRHAVVQALNSVPVNEGAKTILPEGQTNATPWHHGDYEDAVQAVQADLAQNKELSQADIMKTIQGATFLGQGNAPRAEDAKLMLDEMVRRGDVSLNVRPDKSSTPDNPKYLQTVIPAHPMANTPAGMDVRREMLGEGRARREVFSLYEDGQRMGSFPTKQEAEEHGMSRLHDDVLKQVITAAPQQLLPSGDIHPLAKRYAEMAKNELNERQGISRDFRGVTTKQGLEGANERLAKLGIFNEKVEEILPELKKDLEKKLKQYGLGQVAVRMVDSIANGAANAQYHAALIKIAMYAKDPMGELDHETIHALIDLGAFRPDELRVLENKAKSEWLKKYIKDTGLYEKYKEQYELEGRDMKDFEADMLEESVAEAFKHFNKGKPPAGMIGSMFKRLNKFFEAVHNAFTGAGFKTADDIFTGVNRGEFKPTRETAGQSKFSLEHASKVEQAKFLESEIQDLVKKVGNRIAGMKSEETLDDVRKAVEKLQQYTAQGIKGKDWYENSAKAVLDAFNGDSILAEKFFQIIAITSANTEVAANFTKALKAWTQFSEGKPIKVGTQDINKKIDSLLNFGEDWGGRKTNTFYSNLMEAMEGKDTGRSTIDLHMTRMIFDKDAPTDAQYELAENMVRLMASKAGLAPRQVQAASWVTQKAKSTYEYYKQKGWKKNLTDEQLKEFAFEKAIADYSHLIKANVKKLPVTEALREPSASIKARTQNITGEVIPSVQTAMGQAEEMAFKYKEKITKQIAKSDTIQKIAKALGINSKVRITVGSGAYANKVNPNLIVQVVNGNPEQAQRDALDIANAMSYVFKQDATPMFKADQKFMDLDQLGFRFKFDTTDLTPAQQKKILKIIQDKFGEDAGFTKLRGNELVIINYRGEDGKPFLAPDEDFIKGLAEIKDEIGKVANIEAQEKFGAQSEYPYHDWKTEPSGSSIISGIQNRRPQRPNIQRQLDSLGKSFTSDLRKTVREAGQEPKFSLSNEPPQKLTTLEKQEDAGQRLNNTIKNVTDAAKDDQFWTGLRNNWVDKGSSLTKTLQNEEVYKDGQLRADLLNRAYAQVINLVKNGLQSGIPILNSDGSIIIKQDAVNNLANSQIIADRLDGNQFVKDSGLSGRAYVAEVARAMRGKEIMEEDKALGLNRELQVTLEQIAWAEKQIKNVPELNQIFDIWKNVNTSLVNLWEQTGLIDKEEADSYRAKKHYVSLAASKADLEEMINNQYTSNAPGLKSTKKIFKLEGSELNRNIWENVDKQYAAMLTAAYQNHVRKTAVDQLRSIGMATTTRINEKGNEVPLYRADPNINLRYKENGKIVDAIVHNQTDLAAFEAMHYELNPVMKFMAGSTKLLRAGALLNPMFWIRQLVKDPIHANLVANSGIVTPFHSAGEFMRILMKDSQEAKLLAERGVIGQYDSTVDIYDFLHQVGKEKTKPSTLDKALHKLMQVHEASDAATRVAIFKKEKANALAKGMTEADATNFAVMKARESINFAIHGNSKTLFYARHMVPFLSASITSLDTVYRAATGYGLPPAERAAARKLFKQRAFMLAAMTTAYAMLMQNDDDYKKLPDYVKDNNWLIKNPTGDGFIKVPTPFEVGFLFKTIPEAGIRYMYGTSTGKEVLHSYWEGVTNNLPGGALPIPQLFKPAIETITNHSFYTGNTIESLGDARLPVEDRGRNASEIAKKLSKSGLGALNLSPAKIDNLIQGYMAELGTFSTQVADKTIYAAEGKEPPATNLAKDPFFKSFLTDPNANKAVSDFYDIEANANQVAQEFSQLKQQGKAEEIKEFISDADKMKQIQSAPALRRIGQNMTAIRKQIAFIQDNQAMSPEERRDRINQLTAQYNRVAEQGVRIASSLGLR